MEERATLLHAWRLKVKGGVFLIYCICRNIQT